MSDIKFDDRSSRHTNMPSSTPRDWASRTSRGSVFSLGARNPLVRRFSTLEGWRNVGHDMYLMAGTAISTIIPNPTYDLEWPYREGQPVEARLSKLERNRLSLASSGSRPVGRADSTTLSPGGYQQTYQQPRDQYGDYFGDQIGDEKFTEQEGASPSLPPSPPAPEKPYHIFSKRQKWVVIGIIGVAGLFSGLSSNIYLPSLDAIAKDLNVSLAAVSLTITSYLVVQGISPLIWGSLSDTLGRRPIYIYSFTVYIAANLVLSFSPNFPVLLVFRGLQAAGSASTVSIGNGVIQDISTPLERGAFISFYQAIRNFSIAVGPVLGGLLANFLGFRSIFVFLLILSTMVVIAIAVFLPETMRSIAGDGTLRLTGIHNPLIRRFVKEPDYMEDPEDVAVRPKVTLATFAEPLRLVVEKDILASLVFGGLIYTVWSMVVASTTGLFKSRFNLNELTLGLVFIPNGFGTIVGSAVAGKLMTRDFLALEREYLSANPDAPPPSKNKKALPLDFCIEHARLRQVPWITGLFVAATAMYGFSLLPPDQWALTGSRGWIAVPLALQFLIAATSNAVFAVNTTLVSDLCPGKGAGSAAVNNLVRCTMGAVGVGLVDGMLGLVGVSAAFVGLALLVIAASVLLAVEWGWGMQWRGDRERRRRWREEEKVKVMEKV